MLKLQRFSRLTTNERIACSLCDATSDLKQDEQKFRVFAHQLGVIKRFSHCHSPHTHTQGEVLFLSSCSPPDRILLVSDHPDKVSPLLLSGISHSREGCQKKGIKDVTTRGRPISSCSRRRNGLPLGTLMGKHEELAPLVRVRERHVVRQRYDLELREADVAYKYEHIRGQFLDFSICDGLQHTKREAYQSWSAPDQCGTRARCTAKGPPRRLFDLHEHTNDISCQNDRLAVNIPPIAYLKSKIRSLRRWA